jgi:hypothetical protein
MNAKLLSNTVKEEIGKELREAIHTLIRGCGTLDMEMAFQIISDSPDFLMMGTDGSLCDYQTYLEDNKNYLMGCSNFKLATFKEEIRILDRELAIFSWAYGAEATLKTGERDLVENAGASFVFNKVDGEWKVVLFFSSLSNLEANNPTHDLGGGEIV